MRIVVIVLVANLLLVGCHAKARDDRVPRTTAILRIMCGLVEVASATTHAPPPITVPQLVDWLSEHGFDEERFIDYQERSIKDAWGTEVVLIVKDGHLIGTASAGKDRRWDDGHGDDIVVLFEDMRRESEPTSHNSGKK